MNGVIAPLYNPLSIAKALNLVALCDVPSCVNNADRLVAVHLKDFETERVSFRCLDHLADELPANTERQYFCKECSTPLKGNGLCGSCAGEAY